ncbi:ABC transporter permease subunit [Ramlibacter terrae]|uniref:ABC transporter permease subunit n=1 Tax=Ramlibacter terrae TaxID=2732511 RepID=A0ABX6P681_9BURK|nr:ABC transporter permease subunit [Ramlibacter terrae]
MVMALTVVLSVLAGLAFRKKLRGGDALFYLTVASLIMPSIIVSLGIGLQFRLLDGGIKAVPGLSRFRIHAGELRDGARPAHLGAGRAPHRTLPFGLLIMFAVFNRFNPAYEEAARDLGATPRQGFRHVVLPLIGPSVVGVGMFGFTLSWDEIARTSQAIGDVNTLPLELQGLTSTVTTPAIYALGTVTTVVSLLVMAPAVELAMGRGAGRDAAGAERAPAAGDQPQHHGRRQPPAAGARAGRRRRRRRVHTVTARFGAPYIVDEATYAVGAHAALDARTGATNNAPHSTGPHAVLVGCFGDPGLFALRECCGVPVTGLAEAAFAEAATHGRFAVVTGGERWGPMLQRLALVLGHAPALAGIHTVAPTGAQLAADPGAARALLRQACRDAAARFDAAAVIVGGAGGRHRGRPARGRERTPVDSVAAGARAALRLAAGQAL